MNGNNPMTVTRYGAAATAVRPEAASRTLAALLLLLLTAGAATAQSLTVLPVTIQMEPGQMATSLTVINQGDNETAIQIRAFAWSQADGDDQLVSSNEVMTSPPLGTIAPGTSQVVRLVLRQPPQQKEATYRILLDQIPPPAEPGTVRIALRVSIPIFAEPKTRAVSRLQYHVERNAGQAWLVALNDGGRHDTVRDIALTTSDGAVMKTDNKASPYILAGATRRWHIADPARLPAPGGNLRLTARGDAGAIDQPVLIAAAR
jgi:fimbrial chaperone protein